MAVDFALITDSPFDKFAIILSLVDVPIPVTSPPVANLDGVGFAASTPPPSVAFAALISEILFAACTMIDAIPIPALMLFAVTGPTAAAPKVATDAGLAKKPAFAF